jgi:uncharacterized protein (DUF433 family)
MASVALRTSTTYTVAQASYILGLPEKAINNALDRDMAGLGACRVEGGRRTIKHAALLAIRVITATCKNLTVAFRRRIVERVLAADTRVTEIKESSIVVRLDDHRRAVAEGEAKLAAATANITTAADTLGGEPCIVDTRIPVYAVAALLGRHGLDAVMSAYPTLSTADIESAKLYATAHPRKGRPMKTELPLPRGPAVRKRVKRAAA